MDDIFKSLISNLNIFDAVVVIIFIYSMTQCFLKGFSLSLISFAKWILSTVITIILVPKLQPMVSDYVESDFVNSIGLGGSGFFHLITREQAWLPPSLLGGLVGN